MPQRDHGLPPCHIVTSLFISHCARQTAESALSQHRHGPSPQTTLARFPSNIPDNQTMQVTSGDLGSSPSLLSIPSAMPLQQPRSSAHSTPNTQGPIKRDARSESPVFLSSSVLITPREAKQARRRFFDDLGAGVEFPGMPKPISSPDQMTEVQLKKCFDILHACGRATDDQATLKTTRASVDGFLDAVFKDWQWDSESGMVKPEPDFLVEAEVIAGIICTVPDTHQDASTCRASHDTCTAEVTATISFSCNPPMTKKEFTILDSFTGRHEAFFPLGKADVRWDAEWRETLRHSLVSKLLSKLHRYNKHLAVWQARRLIRAWSKGGVSFGPDVGRMGFLGEREIFMVLD